MMRMAPGYANFPTPVPHWILAAVMAVGYAILVIGLDSAIPTVNPWAAPFVAVGGVLLYALTLWLFRMRDPRVWRDAARFDEYVTTWANATSRTVPDAAGRERLRATIRYDAGIAMAQQSGAIAGAGAGAAVSDFGWLMVVIVFTGTMLVVGLTVRRWLVGVDHDTLGSLSSGDERML